jgi:hypothetical protein
MLPLATGSASPRTRAPEDRGTGVPVGVTALALLPAFSAEPLLGVAGCPDGLQALVKASIRISMKREALCL